MPPALQDVHVLRVVVRNDFSRDLAGMLVDDLRWAVERLHRGAAVRGGEDSRSAFHH
jgi:glutamate decarboxylase